MIGIEDEEEQVIAQLRFLLPAVQLITEHPQLRLSPVRRIHLGSKPSEIRNLVCVQVGAQEELAPLQDRVALGQGNGLLKESEDVLVFRKIVPIEPADLVILAISVVVAVLAAQELVAAEDHRRAGGEQQAADVVLDQLPSQLDDL